MQSRYDYRRSCTFGRRKDTYYGSSSQVRRLRAPWADVDCHRHVQVQDHAPQYDHLLGILCPKNAVSGRYDIEQLQHNGGHAAKMFRAGLFRRVSCSTLPPSRTCDSVRDTSLRRFRSKDGITAGGLGFCTSSSMGRGYLL